MLVLSRSQSDRISFPALGISIEVVKVAGNRTSLGIDAPKQIRIVRDELLTEEESNQLDAARSGADTSSNSARHELRNQINRAVLHLRLAEKLFELGQIDQGMQSLSSGLATLSELESGKETDRSRTVNKVDEDKCEFGLGPVDARVLLVDDDENERVLMASYLRRCGMEVIEAGDGLQALYALSQTPRPEAVLLDMKMPNLDGPRTVNRIRSSSAYPSLPIFAVTGESIEDSELSIGEDGVDGWFRKPVNVEQIVAAIKECRAEAE